MNAKCPSCDAQVIVPNDVVNGEIVGCPDCGAEYEVALTGNGEIKLKPSEIEGEDWGE